MFNNLSLEYRALKTSADQVIDDSVTTQFARKQGKHIRLEDVPAAIGEQDNDIRDRAAGRLN